MALRGIFTSNQFIPGERTGDFASKYVETYPTGDAQLLAVSSGFPDITHQSTSITWYEQDRVQYRTAVTSVTSAGLGTTMVVADGSSFIPTTMLLVEETGEHLYVDANPDGVTLTIVRGMADTTPVEIDNTMHVTWIGDAQVEGSSMPDAIHNNGYSRTNLMHIFRSSWSVTGTASAQEVIQASNSGGKLAKSRREAFANHAESKERAFWMSKKHLGVKNGKQLRMCDGLDVQIRNYGGTVVTPSNGTFKHNLFRDFLRRVFEKNIKGQPNERLVFGGNMGLQHMNEAARKDGTTQLETGQSDSGIRFSKFICPFGEVKYMTAPLFNEHPLWSKRMYVLHPGAIEKRTMRKTFINGYDSNNTRIAGIDADQGVMTTETSIILTNGSVHGIYEGITASAASD